MLSRFTSSSALTIHIPPAIYVAGSTIEGEVEVDFRALQEEKIEEVRIRLRGAAKTWIHHDRTHLFETIRLARGNVSLWSRSAGAYPSPGSDVLRVPFAFTLPAQLPPSFHYGAYNQAATVRYSLTAVGVRKGLLTLNKRHRVPLAVLPQDEIGAKIRAKGDMHGWRTFRKEERIRKGFWGEYSKVEVELALPNIPVLPLFSTIPYTIHVRTTSAPLPHSKLPADRPVFPPVPSSAGEIDFRLHRSLKIRAEHRRENPTGDVAVFLGRRLIDRLIDKDKDGREPPVEVDVPAREWAPLSRTVEKAAANEKQQDPGEEKGVCVQRTTFRSAFRLTCPPSFAVQNIECAYELVVKIPFPGIGNNLKLKVPVNVTSGIDSPLPTAPGGDAGSDTPPPELDLPPAYWNADDKEWGDDEKD
ncbi:hypothetical protein C8Q80DRAFT_1114565 [Daedaleopsis nitida]|nr:hypothetical protein C8Q80DRAFT_1114565 [Daedaleopsis nitida]